MFKGGDETSDVSAGFHLHRRGGAAQVGAFLFICKLSGEILSFVNFLAMNLSLDFSFAETMWTSSCCWQGS